MPQESQRDIEKKHGKVLVDFLGIKCTLESGKPPAPDLLFGRGGRRIGVEDTRLFVEDGSAQGTQQARKKLLNTIANATQREYEKRGLPPVDVMLHISRCPIKKTEIKALANQTVDFVTRNLPNPGRTITIEVDNIGDGCLPALIDAIRIFRYPELTSASFFSAPRSAWMRTIDAAYFQQKIDKKATHLQRYLEECNEVWLLMVEEGNDLSNTVEMPAELWNHAYDFGGFARVFVLRGRDERIRELVGY
jgi:hypothetical protein